MQQVMNTVKLTFAGRAVAPIRQRSRLRIYKYFPPEDDRRSIFTEWEKRDLSMLQTLTEVLDHYDNWNNFSNPCFGLYKSLTPLHQRSFELSDS